MKKVDEISRWQGDNKVQKVVNDKCSIQNCWWILVDVKKLLKSMYWKIVDEKILIAISLWQVVELK